MEGFQLNTLILIGYFPARAGLVRRCDYAAFQTFTWSSGPKRSPGCSAAAFRAAGGWSPQGIAAPASRSRPGGGPRF